MAADVGKPIGINYDLYNELHRSFPEVPCNILIKVMTKNCNNRERCTAALLQESDRCLYAPPPPPAPTLQPIISATDTQPLNQTHASAVSMAPQYPIAQPRFVTAVVPQPVVPPRIGPNGPNVSHQESGGKPGTGLDNWGWGRVALSPVYPSQSHHPAGDSRHQQRVYTPPPQPPPQTPPSGPFYPVGQPSAAGPSSYPNCTYVHLQHPPDDINLVQPLYPSSGVSPDRVRPPSIPHQLSNSSVGSSSSGGTPPPPPTQQQLSTGSGQQTPLRPYDLFPLPSQAPSYSSPNNPTAAHSPLASQPAMMTPPYMYVARPVYPQSPLTTPPYRSPFVTPTDHAAPWYLNTSSRTPSLTHSPTPSIVSSGTPPTSAHTPLNPLYECAGTNMPPVPARQTSRLAMPDSNHASWQPQPAASSVQQQAYLQTLLYHQRMRMDKLLQDMRMSQTLLNSLRSDVQLLEGRAQQRCGNTFPRAEDIHAVHDRNLNLRIDIQILTKQLDMLTNGETPLGIVDPLERQVFYSKLPTGQRGSWVPPAGSEAHQVVAAIAGTRSQSAGRLEVTTGGGGGGSVMEVESTTEWNCSACTFLNHPSLDKCEICEKPRVPCRHKLART